MLIYIIILYVTLMCVSCDALYIAVMLSTDEHTKIIKEKETALDKWKVIGTNLHSMALLYILLLLAL